MEDKVVKILNEPLTKYQRQGPGGVYSYVKGEDVIRQLNKAFNHSWTSEVINSDERDEQILILVQLSVWIDGEVVSHQGYGSAPIAAHRSTGKPIDIGNTYKSAFTGALKKAAEQFGIGLTMEEGTTASVPRSAAPSRPSPMAASRRPLLKRKSATIAPAVAPQEPPKTASKAPIRPTGNGSRRTVLPPRNSVAPTVAPRKVISAPAPEVTESATAFPEISGAADPINDLQKSALTTFTKVKSRSEASLISGAIKNTEKTEFDQLTREEASLVIRFATSLP